MTTQSSGKPACRQALAGLDRKKGANASLLLQRYLKNCAAGSDGDPQAKRDIMEAAIAAAKSSGSNSPYAAAFERWRQTLDRMPCPHSLRELNVRSRLIVGLGSENVLEAGITLNHLFGVPVIPGSALKGLAAHYCHTALGATDGRFRKPQDEPGDKGGSPINYHRLLFGTTDESGCIVFHDAWWVPGSSTKPLVRDVMTPHHLDWLEGKKPPTDFDSPTPVPFLSATGKFLMAVSWNGPDSPEAARWVDLAMDLLEKALCAWGAGGKTSSGYGRMGTSPRASEAASGGQTAASPQPASASHQAAKPERRHPGTKVKVRIIGQMSKKDTRLKVREEGRPEGFIAANRMRPANVSAAPGSEVDVEILDDNPRQPQYQWPLPKKD